MKTLLLYSSPEELFLLYAAGYCIAVVLSIYLTRAIFSIPRSMKLKQAEVSLLLIIAKRNASEYERTEIEEIESNLRS